MPSIGFMVPSIAPDTRPTASVDFGRLAEAVGAHSVWVPDRLVYASPDVFVTLAALAATTSRVKIGSAVVLGVLRPPLLVAKAAATIDQLSGGRLILGLGVGSRTEDFDAVQVPIQERGKRMNALIALLREQQPGLPLWFGGRADAVLKRVVRYGTGYIGSTSGGVAGFRKRWQQIRAYAAEYGRDPATITPAALIQFSLDDNGERARAAMHAYLVQAYGPERATDLGTMVGTADDLVRGAENYFAAGVELLIVSSITARLDHLDAFAKDVLPRLPI
jgi:alkanesulfonate monooxygenase SsuD/methylene tetrahydromethanopterin reductase-like flavin-dependent oxidoreductase (luciferase family)